MKYWDSTQFLLQWIIVAALFGSIQALLATWIGILTYDMSVSYSSYYSSTALNLYYSSAYQYRNIHILVSPEIYVVEATT